MIAEAGLSGIRSLFGAGDVHLVSYGGVVQTFEETVADWLGGPDMLEGRPPSCGDWLTFWRVGASEAVSGEVVAPEMAVSERRGLARRSPAEWGQPLLLLLLLGGCSGRIHRLALTVSPAARRTGAGGAVLLLRSPWFGVVSSYLPLCLRAMERPAAPRFPAPSGLVRGVPLSPRVELPGRPRSGCARPTEGGTSPPGTTPRPR